MDRKVKIVLVVIGLFSTFANSQLARKRLIEKLMVGYNTEVRSVISAKTRTNVTVAITLLNFIQTNEAEGWVKYTIYFERYWVDENLKWNPADYDGLEDFLISYKKLWTPQVLSEEIIELEPVSSNDQALCTFEGECSLEQVGTVTVLCTYVVDNYPFDVQYCELSYISSLYNNKEMAVRVLESEVGLEVQTSAEWSLKSLRYANANRTWITNDVPETWEKVIFELTIQRKGTFYLLTIVLPTATITILAIIGLFTPSSVEHERVERVTMGLTALLSVAVMLIIINTTMPKNPDQFPALGWFIISQILIVMFATIVASVVLFMQSFGEFGHGPPNWLIMMTCLGESSHGDDDVTEVTEIPKTEKSTMDSAEWAESKGAGVVDRIATTYNRSRTFEFDSEDELSTSAAKPAKSTSKSAFVHAARTIDKLKVQVSIIRRRCEYELSAFSTDSALHTLWQQCTFRLDLIWLLIFLLIETGIIVFFIVNGSSKYLDSPDGEVGWMSGADRTVKA